MHMRQDFWSGPSSILIVSVLNSLSDELMRHRASLKSTVSYDVVAWRPLEVIVGLTRGVGGERRNRTNNFFIDMVSLALDSDRILFTSEHKAYRIMSSFIRRCSPSPPPLPASTNTTASASENYGIATAERASRVSTNEQVDEQRLQHSLLQLQFLQNHIINLQILRQQHFLQEQLNYMKREMAIVRDQVVLLSIAGGRSNLHQEVNILERVQGSTNNADPTGIRTAQEDAKTKTCCSKNQLAKAPTGAAKTRKRKRSIRTRKSNQPVSPNGKKSRL